MAKYAYVYMVQSLKDGIPPFCLACIGSDNKFTAVDVLQRWKYINGELSLRGIRVINFAADGDSRLLKAMRITSHLISSNTTLSLNESTPLNTPPSCNKWLCTKLYSTCCVQDMIHIAVKFKTRLLKPSIMLPMGCYVASSAHFKIITSLHGKDVHGLRRRDLDCKDKQNFAAIEHLIKAASLLDSKPDAVATKQYLEIVNSSVNSYLDRSYSPRKRLEEIWYAVFFLRYWRQWIIQQRSMTVRDNFITNNCYMCVELNAHSLLAYIITIRDSFPDLPECFTPWIMGSQSAEKMFRSLRSISSTFSTIVNFSMLGMLQRLHKLGIKEDLESESEREHHDIHFSRLESHKKKTGHGKISHFDVCLTDEAIYDSLKQAEERAKSAATKLGMADDLKRKSKWETPPIPSNIMQCEVEDDETYEDEEKVTEEDGNEIDADYTGNDIIDDLQKLKESNVIDGELFKKGTTKAKKMFMPSVGIPTYENKPLTQNKTRYLYR